MKRTTTAISTLAALGLMAGMAAAQTTNLRIQTHYAPETPSGQLAAQFVDDVQVMSNGEITIEMFYSSSVVKTVETFDAAATGILDCDMTGGAYQTGKNPAFQFVGDIMGGYDTPYQQLSWLYYGDGLEAAQELYNAFDMQLIGWWVYGQESLASTKPIAGIADLQDWKFRSPPGLETEIFAELGASPIVMDFTEIFTALETGIIDGADASGIANNVGLGLYDIAKHHQLSRLPLDAVRPPGLQQGCLGRDARASSPHHGDGDAEAGAPDRAHLREEERRGRGHAARAGRDRIRLVRRGPRRLPLGGAEVLAGLGRQDARGTRAGRQPHGLPDHARTRRPVT